MTYPQTPAPVPPVAKKRRWPWVVGGLAVLFVGVAIGSSGSDDKAAPEPAATTTPVTAPAPEPVVEPAEDPTTESAVPGLDQVELQTLALKMTLRQSDNLEQLCTAYDTLGLDATAALVNGELDPADQFSTAAIEASFEAMC